MLDAGDQAPDFTLTADDGSSVSLADLHLGSGSGLAVGHEGVLWAEFEKVAAGFTSLGKRGKPAEKVAEEAVTEASRALRIVRPEG